MHVNIDVPIYMCIYIYMHTNNTDQIPPDFPGTSSDQASQREGQQPSFHASAMAELGVSENPKGSKYHYSRYLGPNGIYYTSAWTLWELHRATLELVYFRKLPAGFGGRVSTLWLQVLGAVWVKGLTRSCSRIYKTLGIRV